MKLVLDEWIVREVIDTLYMARTTLLGITGLDSPQEVAKKSANETAITRRISKAIDIIQQSEQQEVELENYISSKLRELGADLINHKPYSFNKGLNVGKSAAYHDILDRLNARKDENK